MSNLSPKAKKRRRLRSLRNALAILLTFAMVWQMSPFALADDVMLNADGAAATQTDDDAAAAEAEAEAAAAAQAEAEAQAQAEAEAAAAAQAEAEAQAQAEAEARAQAEAEAAAAAQAEAEAQTEAEEEPEAPVEEPANEEPLAAQDAAEQEAPVSTDDETTIVADVETETIAEEAADSIVTSGEEPEADADDEEKDDEEKDDEEKDDEEKDDEDEEEPAKKRVYTYSDGSVSVTATVATPEAVPDDAYLVVVPLVPGSAGYNSYISSLDATYGDEHDASNTLLYDVYFEQVTEEGQVVEVHPTEGSVYVQFSFMQAQLSQGIEAETPADVDVTHFPDGGGVEPLAASVGTDSASFTTPSFSVFAFSYTVDFTYDGYTYCFPGEGTYALADVLAALGIYDAIDSATLTLVDGIAIDGDLYLTQESGVWYISSDVPFTSTYELAVVCGNTTYLIMATDSVEESSDLTNFLINATITGATQKADGTYQVVEGQKYTVALSFKEDSDYQFDNDGTLTYQMPEGILIPSKTEGLFPICVNYRGATYAVCANYTLTTNGQLSITFDTTDTDNYAKLVAATNVSFRFTYEAEFSSSAEQIIFSDEVIRNIEFTDPEPGNVYVNKTGSFDASTGKVNYTITVTADGDVTNVNVKDVITGNALIFNNDVAVSGNSSSYTDNGATNGFDYTFGSMDEGETITITYTASVDFSKDTDKDGKITVDQTKNTVTVTPEDGDPHQSEYSHEIVYKSTNKSDGTEAGTDADGNKILNWTITYNELALAAVGGDTITDTIADTSSQYMQYYRDGDGDGITVHVYDKNNVEIGGSPRNVSWDALTNYTDSTWTYTIPDTDTTPYKYVIEYKTKVDKNKVDAASATVVLNNNANGDWGGYNATPEGLPSIKKAVESSSTTEVTWVATIEVPKGGLSRAVVTDTLPARLINAQSKWYYDLFKDGTLEITGLLEGESYRAQTTGFTDGSKDNSKVVITFYQDEDKTVPGLKSSEEGHTITVKLTSTVDQDWLQYGYGVTDSGQLYLKQHTNTIDINGIQDTATVTYDKLGIKKTGEAQTDANGKVIGLKYTLLIKGVTSSPIIVNDEFDTSLLEVDTSKATQWDHMRIWGGGQWSQSYGRYSVSYTDTDSGITLTANSVPVDEDGNYYSHYKIVYYLKLKDGVDLVELAKANGGTHQLTNTAKWGDHEGTYTYETEYDFLDKQLLNKDELGDQMVDGEAVTNRVANYQITFNPSKATLNDGYTITMTDELSSNLSLDYSSIKIVTDPPSQQVSYVVSGGTDGKTVVTYDVPDETKVTITYSALVTGYNTQTIKNVVTAEGKSEKVVDESGYASDADGAASLVRFKIVKVDGYDGSQKLEGAKFKIYCENGNVDFGSNANNAKELIVESNENGEIILDGATYSFYLYDEEHTNNVYHIKEIEPPAHYASINFDYIVKLTDDMSLVDYKNRIYYYDGDSMQIKNWPLEGLVVEKQVEGDVSADKEFTFRVSILKEDITVDEDYDTPEFTDGVCEFTLKAGQQRMFQDFDSGTKFKVEEVFTDDEGNEYTTEVQYGILDENGEMVSPSEAEEGRSYTGETTGNDQMVRFTNKKTDQTGSLKLTKLVTVNSASTTGTLADGEYTFTVVGPTSAAEADRVTKMVVITVTNGVAASATVDGDTATLDSDGYVVISGLTPGEYTITETAPTNGTTLSKINGVDATGNSTTVTVTAGDTTAANASASFTNNINVGSLTITKTFAGNTDKLTDADKAKVSFTVSGPQWTEAQTLSYADMVDGVKTYENIELGDYTVTESTGDGKTYTTTYKVGSDGTETTGTTATVGASGTTVAFTNTYQETAITLDAEKIIDVKEGVTAPDETFTFTLSAGKVVEAGETSVPMPSDTTASITGAGKVSTGEDPFGAITYTKPGIYAYTITETAGSGAGWTYNVNGAVTATVTVTADATTGALSASAEYSKGTDAAEITNKYEVGSLKISKTLSGNATDANKVFHFTITVEGASGAYTASGTMRSVSFDANGKAEVTLKGGENVTIKGLPVGAAYTVTETEANQDGYTTVGANTSGTIPADSAANATPEAKFTNTKNLGGLTITKTFAGITDKLTDEDKAKISFSVSGPEWDEAQTFTYAEMDNGVKIYENIALGEYTVTESTGEGKAYTTTYKVGSDGTETTGTTATATVGASGTTVAFTNTYQETTATPEVTKEFSDWGKAESFTFTLAAVGDAPMPAAGSEVATATETAKTAKFGEITYTKAGTYEYTITETAGEADGVSYDITAHKVIVTVSKDPDTNALSAEVTYDGADSLTVTNEFTPAKATPEVTKAINVWCEGDEFSFTLAAVGDAPMPAAGGETATATEAAPLAKFGEITYDKAGTYEYTITETNGGADGVAYDITAHKVVVTVTKSDDETNALTAEVAYDGADSLTVTNEFTPVKATPEVTKAINVWCEGDEFSFTLAAVGDAPMPAAGGETATATEAAKTATFGEIEFTAAGTYEYTITETNGGADGVAYDITAHKVVVTVTKADDETNALSAKVTYDGADSLTVTNTFTPVKATPEVTKAINLWPEGAEFAFTLAAVGDAPMPAAGGETATATEAAPLAKFGEIEFTAAGTYEYTITETAGEAGGVTYDTTAHKVTITVTKADDETNALSAKVTYDGADSLTVTNTYDAKGSFTITGVRKTLKNGTLKAGQFKFQVLDAAGNVVATGTNDASGTISFGEIALTLDDLGGAESKDLTYTISEVIPAGATRTSQGYLYNGVYYANQTMTVTVTVTDKGDGTLDVKQATDGKVGVAFTFVNTTTPPIVPHTGDPTSFAALYALATAGLSSIAGGLHMRRRRRREDDEE